MKNLLLTLAALLYAFSSIAQPGQESFPPAHPNDTQAIEKEATLKSENCLNEKGYNDFPFTENNMTVEFGYTGAVKNYSSDYTNCGITTAEYSIHLGHNGTGSFTNSFSSPIYSVVYNITAADGGESITVTVSDGDPVIEIVETDCPDNWTISGNTLNAPGTVAGGRVKFSSTQPFTSITFSHNGVQNGCLFTLCADSLGEGVPAPVPLSLAAILVSLLMIMGFSLYIFRRRLLG